MRRGKARIFLENSMPWGQIEKARANRSVSASLAAQRPLLHTRQEKQGQADADGKREKNKTKARKQSGAVGVRLHLLEQLRRGRRQSPARRRARRSPPPRAAERIASMPSPCPNRANRPRSAPKRSRPAASRRSPKVVTVSRALSESSERPDAHHPGRAQRGESADAEPEERDGLVMREMPPSIVPTASRRRRCRPSAGISVSPESLRVHAGADFVIDRHHDREADEAAEPKGARQDGVAHDPKFENAQGNERLLGARRAPGEKRPGEGRGGEERR